MQKVVPFFIQISALLPVVLHLSWLGKGLNAMQEQGYDMDPSLLFWDNMSAILLKTNWRASNSKRTKHIKVKYYLIEDKVDQKEVTINYCPTEQMWTDINTKPRQGTVFCVFMGHVMGIPAD